MVYRFMLFALLTLGFTSYAQAYSDAERETFYAFAKLGHAGPALTDACGKVVEPKLSTLALGGAVGNAAMLQIEDANCYGMAGSRIIIFKQEGSSFRPIFDTSAGFIVVLKSQHNGVFDIKPAVPGMKIPMWKWNGKKIRILEKYSGEHERTLGRAKKYMRHTERNEGYSATRMDEILRMRSG